MGFFLLLLFALFLLLFLLPISAFAPVVEESSRLTVHRSGCLSVCLLFLLCDRPATKASSEQGSNAEDKKERPTSTMSEASNYTGGSDCSNFASSPNATVAASTTTSTSSARVSVQPALPRWPRSTIQFNKRSARSACASIGG